MDNHKKKEKKYERVVPFFFQTDFDNIPPFGLKTDSSFVSNFKLTIKVLSILFLVRKWHFFFKS